MAEKKSGLELNLDTEIDKLTGEYISSGEVLFKAEDDLEEVFKKAKENLLERVAYNKAEDALKKAVSKRDEVKRNGKTV